MKILIDTNIYLDFYRSNNETLKLFKELVNHFDKIILTDQIIFEFERSREGVIKKVRQNFEAESRIENFSSSYLQDLSEFKDLIELQKQYKVKRTTLINKLNENLEDPSKDPVASFFKEFVDESLKNDKIYRTTEDIIQKANNRKLIGNPPTSDKYSIGDEINWELVIANVKEDIIIVGRDNTYNDNLSFLKKDFHKNTGHLIKGLTDSITKALGSVGVETNQELKDAEEKLIGEIKSYNEYWKRTEIEDD
ncbi:PIN domain-containing protein [Ferruginibacter sp. HRS2-29]|uniref:PIN-like domain-containing protein n=1 Tax=Ferruginibacter sp. HRS2-29 TaxID=2487334 RepID=UPI0020CC13F1|nr:PIN domain-containing protein [Ferruginibacter sp. HRS2-29]MCP9751260.1 hypothetical protein [Ferruginibacter sp. HRS2-29]